MSKMKASRMIRLTLVSTSVAAALMLAGCSVIAPEKLSSDDLMRLANVDQQLMFAAQEPVTAPITMEEGAQVQPRTPSGHDGACGAGKHR